jgi:hypothetical protein
MNSPDPLEGTIELHTGERLFVWGFRTMIFCRRPEPPDITTVRELYDQFNVANALPALSAMVEAFVRTAHTAVALHAPGCPCVSSSEYCLLEALARAQRGEIDSARRRFEQWLPDAAADWVLGPACGLGRAFAHGRLILPIRDAEQMRIHDAAATRSQRPVWSSLH